MAENGTVTARVGWHALIYLVSNIAVRGLAVALTPLYTRSMTPEDFAVVALANTVVAALTIVLGLALHGCIARLYQDEPDESSRRRFLGTLFLFSTLVVLTSGIVLELLGRAGYLDIIPDLAFRPYGEIALWSAVLTNFSALPTSVYMAAEQPRKVAALNIGSGALLMFANIFFVTILHQGALGVLRASCVSAGMVAIASIVLMLRLIDFAFLLPKLRSALLYCLPFVPHLLANWALSVSDRIILAKYVQPLDIARYALAYLFATVVALIGASLTTPVTAAANRQLGDPVTAKNIPPLGTYALLITSTAALVASVNATELIRLLGPPIYSAAATFVPWVALGAVLQTVYLVLSLGTWYSKKTRMVPVVTVLSVVANLGINLVFIPRYGVMVAAISTAVGYAISAVLHGFLAQRNHAIPWEYRRWATIAIGALVTFAALRPLTLGSLLFALAVKTLLCLALFGGALVVLRFPRSEEIVAVRRFIRRRP